jgi:hypothetical protein
MLPGDAKGTGDTGLPLRCGGGVEEDKIGEERLEAAGDMDGDEAVGVLWSVGAFDA